MSLTRVKGSVWEAEDNGLPTHVKDFGAVGDGVTDDTTAIGLAIDSGKALYWGDKDDTYKITSELVKSISGTMNWSSNGATIYYNPVSRTYSTMTISLSDTSHYLKGELNVNVNQKSNVGMKFVPITNGTDYPDLLLEDLHISNTRRETGFNDGDALFIVGSFRNVNIVRPVIKNSTMATGAGVAGTYGIFGITVSRNGSYSPLQTTIRDCWIENVYCDDAAYVSDQDALRLFSRYGGSGTGGLNNPATVKVLGGYIKNVRGRSIKTQTENAIIDGVTLYRTKAAFGGVAGTLTQNADIEVQTGGCTVSNIEFQYEDFVPVRVLRFIQTDETVDWASPQICTNIRGIVSGSYAPAEVVRYTAITSVETIRSPFICSNINVESQTAFDYIFGTTTYTGASSVSITNIFTNAICPVDTALIVVSGDSTAKEVIISNVKNTSGTDVPLASAYTSLAVKGSNLQGTTYGLPTTTAVTPKTLDASTNVWITSRNSTTQTLTLPTPSINKGNTLILKNIGSVQVDSASSNVVPLSSATAGTAIFAAATAGKWLELLSDGTNWIAVKGN